MLVKYLSYSLVTVNRQPSTVNRQPSIMRNLSFALFFNFVRKNLIQKENFKKNSKKLLLTILFSTVLLAVSCANSAPFEVGGGLDSIPTASGTAATLSELLNYKGTYTGTIGSGSAVTQKKYTSNPKEYGEQYSIKDIKVVIDENKIFYTGMDANNTKPRSQLYKSTDGKSFIASDDTDIGEHRYKSYIKITFNSANTNIYLHQGMSGPLKKGVTVIQKGEYVAEYEGNLIKTQP